MVTIPPEERAGAGPGGGAMVTVTAVPMDPRVPKIRIKTRQLAQVRDTVLGHELHEPFIVGVAYRPGSASYSCRSGPVKLSLLATTVCSSLLPTA